MNTNVVPSKERLVRNTFYITYAFLITTGTITFIEAMRTNDSKIRHILNLETVISIVAGYFYTVFMRKINNNELNYSEINLNRYIDWAITTPVMLLVLCLVFVYNNKTKLTAGFFLIVLIINYVMLGAGYMGETKMINKRVGWTIGSLAFIVLYGLLYFTFIQGKNVFDNKIIFWAFLIFWAGYGIAYNLDNETRNISYNILDLFSKCFVGIFFWAYLTKVLVIF
jgi:bacteriorhodopsin